MTAPTTPGLTYWRCPACGHWVGSVLLGGVVTGTRMDLSETWDLFPRATARCERLVEAHEAEHLTVTG